MWLSIGALAVGFLLGALHQRRKMTKLALEYSQTRHARRVSRAIVLEEWVATVRDPEMRPLLHIVTTGRNTIPGGGKGKAR